MKKVELLAPVGKIENAYAAIENGADAIFVGGKLFNARHFADNFDEDELDKIVKYCKVRDVKVYITLNTLIKNNELRQVFDYITYLQKLGVDAVIVQDFGVARLIKKYFKDITLHASTQMTAHSLEDVNFLKTCGFKRVVLARELQLKEIEEIKEQSDMEIEVFIHGALCYSYSGQCLFSSLIGGRSGNRGRCAQPCRMTYSLLENGQEVVKDLHLLSPKDIYTLPFVKELIASGIDSLKIEGRMKSPEYVASVVGTYRKYIDLVERQEEFTIDPVDIENLQSIFNRGGLSKGYFYQKAGNDMITEKTPKNIGIRVGKVTHYNSKTKMVTIHTDKELHPGDGLEIWNTKKHTGTGITQIYEANSTFTVKLMEWADPNSFVYLTKNHELLKTLKKSYEKEERKLPIFMHIIGRIGQPICIKLSYKSSRISVVGDCLEIAQNKPIDEEIALKQLCKMGNTPFRAEHVTIDWEMGGYITISKLNELRRSAVSKLEEAMLRVNSIETNISYPLVDLKAMQHEPEYVVHVHTLEQLMVCMTRQEIKHIYWEWHYNDEDSYNAYELCQQNNKAFYLALPPIMKNTIWKKYEDAMCIWKQKENVGFLIRTYGQHHFFKDAQKPLVIDYTLNVFNNESVAHWIEEGAMRITLSMELSREELEQFKGPVEKVIYGKIPVMTTEQCILGNTKRCMYPQKVSSASYTLKDRKDVEWKIFTDCESCKMQILSLEPMWVNPLTELKNCNIAYYRLAFTDESKVQTKNILETVFDNNKVTAKVIQGMFLKSIE